MRQKRLIKRTHEAKRKWTASCFSKAFLIHEWLHDSELTQTCEFNTQELNTHRPAPPCLSYDKWVELQFRVYVSGPIWKSLEVYLMCSDNLPIQTEITHWTVMRELKEVTGSCLIWVWISTMKSMLLSSFLKCSISFSKRWFSEQTFKTKHFI